MESAVAVVDGAGRRDWTEVASRLSELVECSLIVSEGSAESPRFRMLEAQRFYALENSRPTASTSTARLPRSPRCRAFEAGYLG
jgi:hypothetical protein